MYTDITPTSINEFIDDYCKFGVFNGLYCIEAILSNWDAYSDKKKCILTAKVLAEYSRAIEEIFAFVFAMKKQIQSRNIVFWDSLVNYNQRELGSFISDSTFSNISDLLEFPPVEKLSHKLGYKPDDVKIVLKETGQLLEDIKLEKIQDQEDERIGQVQRIYNKLKHPCLLISVPSEIRDSNNCFGVIQSKWPKSVDPDKVNMACECIQIDAHEKISFSYYENVKQITYGLIFLLKCFKAKYEIGDNS